MADQGPPRRIGCEPGPVGEQYLQGQGQRKHDQQCPLPPGGAWVRAGSCALTGKTGRCRKRLGDRCRCGSGRHGSSGGGDRVALGDVYFLWIDVRGCLVYRFCAGFDFGGFFAGVFQRSRICGSRAVDGFRTGCARRFSRGGRGRFSVLQEADETASSRRWHIRSGCFCFRVCSKDTAATRAHFGRQPRFPVDGDQFAAMEAGNEHAAIQARDNSSRVGAGQARSYTWADQRRRPSIRIQSPSWVATRSSNHSE